MTNTRLAAAPLPFSSHAHTTAPACASHCLYQYRGNASKRRRKRHRQSSEETMPAIRFGVGGRINSSPLRTQPLKTLLSPLCLISSPLVLLVFPLRAPQLGALLACCGTMFQDVGKRGERAKEMAMDRRKDMGLFCPVGGLHWHICCSFSCP